MGKDAFPIPVPSPLISYGYERREERDDDVREFDSEDLRNTVCGTTPSLGNSTSPMFLRYLSGPTSLLDRDEKLCE